MQGSERESLTGDLAGQWQSHMYFAEDAKRSLAHATRNNKNSNQMSEINRIRTLVFAVTTAERSHSAIVTFLDKNKFLHRVYINIYSLKLEIAHSGPGNLGGDKNVYITTRNISLNTWTSSEALRIAMPQSRLSCIRPTISAAKFSRILQQPARFKRNMPEA